MRLDRTAASARPRPGRPGRLGVDDATSGHRWDPRSGGGAWVVSAVLVLLGVSAFGLVAGRQVP
ncbi:MAG: hypothetical protein HOQ22_02515, partial [Nocardioidaceae bacterium]|nr:hypothetical protein [Nocardioidaceae bacterium]